MTRILSLFAGAALLVGLTALPASAQTGAAGSWEIVLQAPQGAQNMTLTVKVDGEKADGSMASAMGEMPLSGKVTTGGVELNGNLEIQGMSLAIVLTANVAGDTISGGMKFGDFGEAPFEGKRAGNAAASATPAAPAPPAGEMTGVNGKWNVTLTLQGIGDVPVTATLTQAGEVVTGTLTSMMGEVPIKGTFKGTALNLEFTSETPQGPMNVTMTGELTGGNLAGKATITGMGEAEWKAVRGQ